MAAQLTEEEFKRRARRRLIGAVALVVLAVAVLPKLLQNQPPPAGGLAVEMPAVTTPAVSEVAPDEQAAPVSSPSSAVAHGEVVPAAPEAESAGQKAAHTHTVPAQKSAAASAAQPVVSTKAPGGKVEKAVAAPGDSTYVVQVGAFSDADNATKLKTRIVALKLPAYTDKVNGMTRLRVGPFASKAAAERAAALMGMQGISGRVETP